MNINRYLIGAQALPIVFIADISLNSVLLLRDQNARIINSYLKILIIGIHPDKTKYMCMTEIEKTMGA